MIIVTDGIVQCKQTGPEELLQDTACVIATFIKLTKSKDVSDELIEKTLIRMIAEGFSKIDVEVHTIDKRTGEIT